MPVSTPELEPILKKMFSRNRNILLFFGLVNVLPAIAGVIAGKMWVVVLFAVLGAFMIGMALWAGKLNRYAAWRALHGGPEDLTSIHLSPWAHVQGTSEQLSNLARTMDWKVTFGIDESIAPNQFYRLQRKDEGVFLAGILKLDPDLDIVAETLDGQVSQVSPEGQLTRK
jgi:hypothetical protein